MTDGPVSPPPAGNKSLIARVQGILLKPKDEWAVIENEPATVGSIFTSYVVILAAIGPIASLIGQQAIGVYGWKPPIAYSVTMAVVGYLMALVGIYLLAIIIDALAPSFGGTKDSVRAMKAAAYSWTAAWLAAIFGIIPQLGIVGLLGLLYSLYLLYLGLPRLMRVTQDKAVGYVVVTVIASIVIYFVAAVLVGILVVMFVGVPTMPGVVVYR